MASETEIIAGIASMVNHYSNWTIGITDDPDRRRVEHGNPPTWRQWDADTEQEARNVEAHFIARGMKPGVSGPGRAGYVYVFSE